jgi:predicted alpha/beta-hydrolase family hydrolase
MTAEGTSAPRLIDGPDTAPATLILQGERDSFGRREEVQTYSLSPAVQLGWIPSGDHSFKPSHRSGLSEAENWATAVALSDLFMRQLTSG